MWIRVVLRRFGESSALQRLHGERAMIFAAFVAEGAVAFRSPSSDAKGPWD